MRWLIDNGRLELRPDERALWCGQQPVPLGARAFDVLVALVTHRDRVVTKNELLDLVWPGMVVEENNLTVQVSSLRKCLGNHAIATITGRGYRFALPVDQAAPSERPPLVTGLHGAEPLALQRQLVAVVVADVVGWPRLLQRDALAAVQAWRALRSEVIEPTVARSGGRVVELTPEHAQLAFGSAVQAVGWAVDLQRGLCSTRDARPGAALRLRIGITVDDVIVDEGKLIGEGVHMALDILQAASHDDVLVSREVMGLVQRHVPFSFLPEGERFLQRVSRQEAVYRVVREPVAPSGLLPTPSAVGHRATVAVLPFLDEAVGADPYFGDGLGEEIIATLAQDRGLFVIAHGSTLKYRDRGRDLGQVAAELGVHYLLTGQIRRDRDHLRISVSLQQADDNRVIWQQRYDGQTDEVFDFQARIAASVAAAMQPALEAAEIARVRHRPSGVFGAYDCLLRALPGMYSFGSPDFLRAGDHLRQAVELAPEYAAAHANLAWWYSLCAAEGIGTEDATHAQLALDHALTAVRLDPGDAHALSVAGHLLTLFRKQHEQAMDLFDQALRVQPGSVWAWARSATTLAYLGQGDEALSRSLHALRLSPFDRNAFSFMTTAGTACLVAGRADQAMAWLGKALRARPGYNGARRLYIAALVAEQELQEAQAVAQGLVADVPGFSLEQFGAWYPMREPHLQRLLDLMRRAGLPA